MAAGRSTRLILGLVIIVVCISLFVMFPDTGGGDLVSVSTVQDLNKPAANVVVEANAAQKPAEKAADNNHKNANEGDQVTQSVVVEAQKRKATEPEIDCEKRTDEVVCDTDERWRVKPIAEGVGEGTETSPYKNWNAEYHRKRALHRKRYEAEDEQLAAEGKKHRPTRIHTFYTIDCALHSLWQIITLEQSWEDVNQGGVISRVSSGCNDGPRYKREYMAKYIISDHLLPNIGTFYAPTFSKLPNGEHYAPFNRPNGIWHWLNHTDLTEDVYIALDPDMLYMNRMTVSNIKPGHFASQYYGYMTTYPFHKYKCDLCPKEEYYNGVDTQSAFRRLKKIHPMRPEHKKFNFDVGPPWIFTLEDLKTIMPTWVKLVVILKEMDKALWIAEMVAYSVACAYHDIPHDVIYYGMVDNPGQEKAWQGNQLSSAALPHPMALLHFCFTWEVGERPPQGAGPAEAQHNKMVSREQKNKQPVTDYYHFSKYRVPTDWPGGKGRYQHNFFDCESPLIQEFHTVNNLPDIDRNPEWRRVAQFMDIYLPKVNAAMAKWKMHVAKCAPEKMNLEKRLRTSHPRYWFSEYVINRTSTDGKSIDFFKSPVRKELGQREGQGLTVYG